MLQPRLEELVTKSLRTGKDSGIGQEIEAETATHLRQAAETATRAMRAAAKSRCWWCRALSAAPSRAPYGGIMPVIALEEIPETLQLQVVQTAEPGAANDDLSGARL